MSASLCCRAFLDFIIIACLDHVSVSVDNDNEHLHCLTLTRRNQATPKLFTAQAFQWERLSQ
ncbi:hypothetical protein T4E_8065 [Trichinella pseudospiralis]|uniref:Uncharacterized protein n=1 Tax=Trichinella pseudospiralis TaxID=6337 RepID=A0A0V0XZ51_TRIPS|nr:hypothetical protein T4E_8065 [Trichinella pseudospiralis]